MQTYNYTVSHSNGEASGSIEAKDKEDAEGKLRKQYSGTIESGEVVNGEIRKAKEIELVVNKIELS